jgi:hypothetical protein
MKTVLALFLCSADPAVPFRLLETNGLALLATFDAP